MAFLNRGVGARWSVGLCLGAALTAVGCDGSEDANPSATLTDVAEIFDRHGCAEATCHGPNAPQGDLDLSVAALDAQLVGVACSNPSAESTGMLRVTAGDPDASFLYTKITLERVDPQFGAPMPPVGGPLSDEELGQVLRWIEQGAVADEG